MRSRQTPLGSATHGTPPYRSTMRRTEGPCSADAKLVAFRVEHHDADSKADGHLRNLSRRRPISLLTRAFVMCPRQDSNLRRTV